MRQHLGGLAPTLASRLAVVLSAGFFSAVVARLLGPDGKGLVTIATLTPALAANVLVAGYPQAVLQFRGGGPAGVSMKRLIFVVSGFTSAAGLAAGLLGLVHISIGIAVLALPGLIAQEMWAADLQVGQRFRAVALLRGLAALVPAVLGTGMAIIDPDATKVCAAFSVAHSLFALAALRWGLLRNPASSDALGDQPPTPHLSFRQFARGALRSNASLLLLALAYRVDLLVLAFVADATAVGIYSVAVNVAELLWLPALSLAVVTGPRYSAADARDRKRIERSAAKLVLLFTIPSCVAVGLTAKPLIQLIFGPAFDSSAHVLWALLPGVLLFSLFRVVATLRLVEGRAGAVAGAGAIAVISQVALVWWLGAASGAVGAGYGCTVAYAMSTVWLLFVSQRHRRAQLVSRAET